MCRLGSVLCGEALSVCQPEIASDVSIRPPKHQLAHQGPALPGGAATQRLPPGRCGHSSDSADLAWRSAGFRSFLSCPVFWLEHHLLPAKPDRPRRCSGKQEALISWLVCLKPSPKWCFLEGAAHRRDGQAVSGLDARVSVCIALWLVCEVPEPPAPERLLAASMGSRRAPGRVVALPHTPSCLMGLGTGFCRGRHGEDPCPTAASSTCAAPPGDHPSAPQTLRARDERPFQRAAWVPHLNSLQPSNE